VKSFGATHAVKRVSLVLPAGEIIGLVGENGAGKSTLAKLIAGVHAPDSGTIELRGEPVTFRSPFESLKSGIAMMAQEIMLVPDATVEENIFLGNMPAKGIFPDHAAIRKRFQELIELTKFDLDPAAQVSRLRLADQQKVEILRSLSRSAELIIMDEPSASLTADEIEHLHDTIRELARRGVTVLLISHFLDEILSLTSTVVVMRDGELIRSGPTSQETVDSLVSGMVGRTLETRYFESVSAKNDTKRLDVRNLNTKALKDVSFQICEGEILGLAGLIGAGRTEIARAIYGADKLDSGEIYVDGVRLQISSPHEAISKAIFMVPESRKEQGLLGASSLSNNMVLSTLKRRSRAGFLSNKSINAAASTLAGQVDLRYTDIRQSAGSLSGGNQQKILFGRAIEVAPRILIVDEPTRGVDIAAKRAIHQTLINLAKTGMAILFISSEIEEVLGVCDRVLVIHQGKVHAEFTPPFDQKEVVAAFFGQRSGDTHD
jgi:rhamnose transport system ATP-binding protein